MSRNVRRYVWPLILLLLPLVAQAGIVISGTRIIYPADKREITLQLNNTGDSPALVQSWIDSGNTLSQPEQEKAPFIILPPVSRVEAKSGQTLRIMYNGSPLPQDRESLYWFNLLEIPPQPDAKNNENYLQFAVRSRLKFFFRPAGLKADPAKVAEQLQWHLESSSEPVLAVHNPTPYHVTLSSVRLAGHELSGDMVAPFANLRLPLPAKLRVPLPQTLNFSLINDYGAQQSHQIALNK